MNNRQYLAIFASSQTKSTSVRKPYHLKDSLAVGPDKLVQGSQIKNTTNARLTMGTFAGHIIPGAFISCLSMWWTYSSYKIYYKSLYNGKEYRSSVCFPLDKYPNLPLESIVKLITFLMVMVGDATYNGITHINIKNEYHMSIYFFFVIQSAVEIFQFYKFHFVPPNAEYFTSVLGFLMQAFLFSFHTHGRSELDVLLHTLVVLTAVISCFTMTLETFIRDSLVLTLARSHSVLIQGTWITHIGFILYPPTTGMNHWVASKLSHSEAMLLVILANNNFESQNQKAVDYITYILKLKYKYYFSVFKVTNYNG
uniref:Transmembrane protein 45B n=1 Tax=Strigamia maritima TaxID=126957 RepID=T1JB65_STRMM